MKKNNRNYGIDLLRIIAMGLVLMLHLTGFSDMENNLLLFSSQFEIYRFIDIISICAVTLFGLLSGYTLYQDKYSFRGHKLISLWIQTFFYAAFNSILCYLVLLQSPDISVLFPISMNRYWYVTAYFIVYIFSPIINLGLSQLSRQKYNYLLGSLFLLTSIFPTLVHNFPFGGDGALKLLILYFFGAYIKKYNIIVNAKKCFTLFFIITTLTWLGVFALDVISKKVLGAAHGYGFLISNHSPLIVINSLLLLIGCKNINTDKWNARKRFVSFIAPMTFGVYLCHMRSLIWELFLYPALAWIQQLNSIQFLLVLLLLWLITYFGCLAVEFLRTKLFKLLNVSWIENKVLEIIMFAENKIEKLILKYFLQQQS